MSQDTPFHFGENYDLTRYRLDGEDEFRTGLPTNDEWDRINFVTIEYFLANGQTTYRNYVVDGGLDVYDADDADYDLDDLAYQGAEAYGFETA